MVCVHMCYRDLRRKTKLSRILVSALCCDCIDPYVSIDNGTLVVEELLHDVTILYSISATPSLTLSALRAWANTRNTLIVVHHVVLGTAHNTAPSELKQPTCGGQERRQTVSHT